MATADQVHRSIERLGVHPNEHPAWSHSFSEEQQLRQLKEDLFASKSVSGVLVTIVSMGLILAFGSLLFCL